MFKINRYILYSFVIIIIFTSCSQQTEEIASTQNKTLIEGTTLQCNEYEYWEEVSNDFPYPGMKCGSGPMKTIDITFHIAKEINSKNYLNLEGYSAEEAAKLIISQLNEAFNPHGINSSLDEIFYIPVESPHPGKLKGGKEALENWYDKALVNYNPENLNFVFKPYSGFSCPSNLWNLSVVVRKSRCQSIALNIANTPMVHEVGHFFGLLHTHHDAAFRESIHDTITTVKEDFNIRGPSWVEPEKDCHKTGDYVCDTPYDCHDFCQETLNCKGFTFDRNNKRHVADPSCGNYNPIRSNIMSYYQEYLTGEFTKEQGARMRYFLMHRLRNDVNGNILREKA